MRRVARELASAGWTLQALTTDNGSEFRAGEFRAAVQATGAEQRFIRAGRPQTNGAVEQVQRTILEECWRPSFVPSLVPKYTALRRDLERYLAYFNWHRARTGRHTKGEIPVYGRLWCTEDAPEMSRSCHLISWALRSSRPSSSPTR